MLLHIVYLAPTDGQTNRTLGFARKRIFEKTVVTSDACAHIIILVLIDADVNSNRQQQQQPAIRSNYLNGNCPKTTKAKQQQVDNHEDKTLTSSFPSRAISGDCS